MWSPELTWRVAPLATPTREDIAFEVEDADAGAELRHVHDVVLIDEDLARLEESRPHVKVLAVGREDLDAVVRSVRDVDLPFVLPDAVDQLELAGALAGLSPREEQRPVG